MNQAPDERAQIIAFLLGQCDAYRAEITRLTAPPPMAVGEKRTGIALVEKKADEPCPV